MFSNLSIGSPIHILDTNNGVNYYNPIIESISPVRPMYNTYNANSAMGMNMGAVVDITVSLEGKKKEFSGVLASSSVSNNNGYILTENKEAMVSQVDLLMQNSKNILENIDKHKSIVSGCEEVLKKINPTFAKESARDDAITALTERVNNIQSEFGDLKNGMSQVLSILKKENINT